MRRVRRRLGSVLATAFAVALCASPASAAPGPVLEEPPDRLAAALECSGGLQNASRIPVLLVHGTGSNRHENWSWGYRKVLPERGYPTCTVELPDRAFVDIQRSVEYVIFAIRHMAAASDRQVSVVGQSQGGIHPVWALKFWPDLPPLVRDVIAMGTPYQGSEGRHSLPCESEGCPPAVWQQGTGANFIGALNRGSPPGAPSYTSIATQFDQVAFPQPESSRLAGAREIVIQDMCPRRPVEHYALAADAAAFALVIDALEHPGPADPARIPNSVCQQTVFAGADAAQLAILLPAAVGSPLVAGVAYEGSVTREPPLRCYADPDCPRANARCAGRSADHFGTDGRDRVAGTARADAIALFAGRDFGRGRAGADRLCGGGGKDRLKGDAGRDRLRGGAGRDILRGGPGHDVLVGGGGNDHCDAGRRDVVRSC